MRKFCCSLLFLVLTGMASAQRPVIDSLKSVLHHSSEDSNRVIALWRLAEQYKYFRPDTTLKLAHEALVLSRRINYIEGESRSLAVMATGQYLLGDYSKALNNYMLKLQLEEKRNSSRNYASALNNIGLTYILLAEYPTLSITCAGPIQPSTPQAVKRKLNCKI
jgi:two-component system, NtrC family, sensor kinase